MKRIGNLYEQIVSVENCRTAILNASRHKHSRREVQRVLNNIDFYANDLSRRIQRCDFITPYKSKVVCDGLSRKTREILVPRFYPDQCSHHAIIQVIQKPILKSSYYWSCANIPHRGIDHASKGVERATKRDIKHSKYCFKCDISKFYPSVNHQVLRDKLRRKFKDDNLLFLLDLIIVSCEKGIPIGNYTSPYFAEIMLQGIDDFILSCNGVKHYVRYADDMVIIGNNKRKLHKACECLKVELAKIDLILKDNYQVFPIQRGYKGRRIDFVGKCFGLGFTTIRKRRSLKLIRQSNRIRYMQKMSKPIPYRTASGIISRATQFLHTNSYKLKIKYYSPIKINELKEIIRNYGMEQSKRHTRLQTARG